MLLELRNLTKSFGPTRALNEVHLDLSGPGLHFLGGPNGSGKTTLFKSILGLVIPDHGCISYQGQVIDARAPKARAAFGYMPQVARFPQQLTTRELTQITASLRGGVGNPDRELMELFRVEEFWDKPLMALSGGTRQKALAALAFYANPELVILDEPTAGLDPEHSDILLRKLERAQTKKLIVLSTHILYETNRMGATFTYMKEGQVAWHANLNDLRERSGATDTHRAIIDHLRTMS